VAEVHETSFSPWNAGYSPGADRNPSGQNAGLLLIFQSRLQNTIGFAACAHSNDVMRKRFALKFANQGQRIFKIFSLNKATSIAITRPVNSLN
jgi:hypothetical protein